MTQTYPTMQWNTRERALSNDLNKQARLVSRGITETATAIVSGTLRKAGVFGIGFLVTPMAGTMKSTISPGTALFVDGVSVYPDSTVQWVESTVIREVTHEAAEVAQVNTGPRVHVDVAGRGEAGVVEALGEAT